MSQGPGIGLRARFLAAGSLLVLTTVAAGLLTVVILSELAEIAESTVQETDEATAAAAAAASALEREDDALLVVLGGGARARELLLEAREVTDRARARLDGAAGHELLDELETSIAQYRGAVEAIVAAPGPEPLERYHLDANPPLRASVSVIGRIRDQRFERARSSVARARDEVKSARSIVSLISALAMVIATAVALRLARHVLQPLGRLSAAAEAIRDGRFETRIWDAPGDEIGQVIEAFNEMTRRLAEFHHYNLGEVLRAKQALEATMQALPDAVVLIGADRKVAAMNSAAEQLFLDAGCPRPASADDVLTLAPQASRFAEALLGQHPVGRVDLQSALRIPMGGGVRRLVPRIVPISLDPEGGGVVLVLSDVTELARFDEMRTELVAVASHELRTPVTTLQMSLFMLRESARGLDERFRALVDNALGGVEQLGETVDELLDMTRIEAGKLKLLSEPLELGSIVREVTERSRARAEELGVGLEVHADVAAGVVGDRARLRIVIDNIVTNALKYTPRGGHIALEVARRGGEIAVSVTDTGPGIPSEFHARVFEKFFRVEHHRPRGELAARGSGIGLYLCKEIVELHGGTICCEDAPSGTGARLSFVLPAAPP